ncbi:MAG: hypothetical protein DPW18_17690 [Chloroflexi bacterium]|nr:hypothetical protein [Chloroflexota bacterium]MDL1944509.1 DUF385 domain-containing protein [Chloroflexi bacterium CFX2]
MTGNDFMAWVLRSPFHFVLSGGMMLITVTGRKTGRKYTTPVGYYREREHLWVLTSRNRTWWRNLLGGAEVGLLLKRQPARAFAQAELDEKSVEMRMYEFLRHVPQAARSMKIRIEDEVPNAEDIARTAKERLFVRIKLAR